MLYEMLVYIFLLLVQAGSLFYSHIANKNVLLKAFPAGWSFFALKMIFPFKPC